MKEADLIIEPRRGKKEKLLPARALLVVNPAEADYALGGFKPFTGESRSLYQTTLLIDKDRSLCLAGPALGAAAARVGIGGCQSEVLLRVNAQVWQGHRGAANRAVVGAGGDDERRVRPVHDAGRRALADERDVAPHAVDPARAARVVAAGVPRLP